MNTANNHRFQATDRRIKDSFLDLLQQKTLDKITVGELCTASGCNRSTFYAHFLDIYDLMEKIQLDVYDNAADTFKSVEYEPNNFYIHRGLLTKMLVHIQRNRLFYNAYLCSGKFDMEKPGKLLYEHIMRPFFISLGFSDSVWDERRMTYHFRFFFSGMIEVMRIWVRDGCPETPEKLSKIIWNSIATPERALVKQKALSEEITPEN